MDNPNNLILPDNSLIASQRSYIADYLYRFSNDECHPDFHFWSCLTLLGHVVGSRIWTMHGRFAFSPRLYTLMVGSAGSGKSTAMREAKKLFVSINSLSLISEHIESREYIIGEMVDYAEFWRLPNEPKLQEYHPMFLVVNELAEFISVNPAKMLGFLIDVFDETSYGTGFKKDKEAGLGSQRFPNPCVSMIACAQPHWFLSNVKSEIFTRGLGRRCIILAREKFKLNDSPMEPSNSEAGWLRVKQHLTKLSSPKFFGEIKKTPAAAAWYTKWHNDPKRTKRYDDPILNEQLLETQHVLLYKVATLLALSRYDFDFTITENDYILALKNLHALEKDIAELMSTTGKNEMVPVAAMMVQAIDSAGGWMEKAKLLLAFYRHAKDQRAFNDGLNFLCTTKQVYERKLTLPGDSIQRVIVATPAGRQKLEEKGIRFED